MPRPLEQQVSFSAEELQFVTPEHAGQIIDFYSYVTYNMVNVGETKLRLTSRQDNQYIEEICKSVNDGTTDTASALNQLKDVMGSGRHSLLSKVLAISAYYDIAKAQNYWGEDFEQFFNDVVTMEPTPHGGIILLGAFYAKRFQELAGRYVPTDNIIKEFDSILVEKSVNESSERKRIAIHASGFMLAQMMLNDQLKLGLPSADIFVSDEVKNRWRERQGGYPRTTMILPVNKLPVRDKLYEAAVHGVPQPSGVLDRRFLRVMVGEEISVLSPYASQATGLRRDPNRRFYYVYVPSFDDIHLHAKMFFNPEVSNNFNDYDLLEKASFDAISFWGACRVSDRLRKMYDIDSQFGKELPLNIDINEVQLVVNEIVADLASDKERPNGTHVSLLGLATSESQMNITVEQAQEHLTRNILAHVLVFDKKLGWGVRDREKLASLYRSKVWQTLTPEDRLEFGLVLLYPGSPHWSEIGTQQARDEIRNALDNKIILTTNQIKAIEAIGRHNVVLRCETIVDTYEPEEMQRLRVKNSIKQV